MIAFGVKALSIFFFLGALVSFISCLSLLFPGSVLEPMWLLNPRAHEALHRIGWVAIPLLMAVCIACASSAIGLWHHRRWGYLTAVGLIAANLLGDILNTFLGTEPKAAIGIPIAGAILMFLLSKRAKAYFR